jgi:hypothetical protein
VKAVMRGIGLAALGMCLAGLAGCGAGNESDAMKTQQNLGAPPAPVVKGGEATPPPRTYAERQPPGVNPELKKQFSRK